MSLGTILSLKQRKVRNVAAFCPGGRDAGMAFVLAGLLSGILSGLLGIGGGILLMPILIYAFGFN